MTNKGVFTFLETPLGSCCLITIAKPFRELKYLTTQNFEVLDVYFDKKITYN